MNNTWRPINEHSSLLDDRPREAFPYNSTEELNEITCFSKEWWKEIARQPGLCNPQAARVVQFVGSQDGSIPELLHTKPQFNLLKSFRVDYDCNNLCLQTARDCGKYIDCYLHPCKYFVSNVNML